MKTIALICIVLGWWLAACVAIPPAIQVPMLEKKGDLVATNSINITGLGGNLLYAPTNHLGLSLGGGFHALEFRSSEINKLNQTQGELGVHGFYKLMSTVHLSISAFGGIGGTRWNHGLIKKSADFSANFHRLAVQPAFRYQPGKFYMSGALRYSNWGFRQVNMVYNGEYAERYQEDFNQDPNLVNPTIWSRDIAFQFGYLHQGIGAYIQFLFSKKLLDPFAVHPGFTHKGYKLIYIGMSFAPIELMNRKN